MSANTPLSRAGLVLTALVLAISACGGDDGGGSDLQVSMTEFAYAPQTVTVQAGEEFTLALDNDGTVIHNWSLVVPGREISSESDLPENPADRDDLYLFKEEVEAGESSTRRLVAPPAGTYQVICDIQAHFSAGMVGTLIVEG